MAAMEEEERRKFDLDYFLYVNEHVRETERGWTLSVDGWCWREVGVLVGIVPMTFLLVMLICWNDMEYGALN